MHLNNCKNLVFITVLWYIGFLELQFKFITHCPVTSSIHHELLRSGRAVTRLRSLHYISTKGERQQLNAVSISIGHFLNNLDIYIKKYINKTFYKTIAMFFNCMWNLCLYCVLWSSGVYSLQTFILYLLAPCDVICVTHYYEFGKEVNSSAATSHVTSAFQYDSITVALCHHRFDI